MAFPAPAPAAAEPAHEGGTAAVVAPSGSGDLYLPALARHGWKAVAVTASAAQISDGYLQQITPRASLRRTAAGLKALGVQAVIAGSPAGTELADRLADRLRLPGNSAAMAGIRRDTGLTIAALCDAGISAPRSIRTARLTAALRWAAFVQVRGFVLQHPDPAHPHHPGRLCRTADDIACAWRRLQRSGRQPLVLREHLAGRQFRIHTLSGPGPGTGGITDHTITSIWSETRTPGRHVCRADLVNRNTLLARALAFYAMRVLTALGVRHGPACVTVTYTPGRKLALLSLRTGPYDEFTAEVLRRATGHDPVHDTVRLLDTGRLPRVSRPFRHAMEIVLLPQHDGALDSALLRTITGLPTVAATTGLSAGAPVRAGRPAGRLLLVADDRHAVHQDHQTIRTVEATGLYGGPS